MSEKQSTNRPRVAIIGAGIGGLTFAIGLKKQLGFEDFTIYEAASDVGGTWRDNTYPGCCSDVATHLYSLSTEPNPLWSRTHVLQPEIQAYWVALARKHALYEHTQFHTRVAHASWDAVRAVWVLRLENTRTGEGREVEAQVLISAMGLLREPVYPPDVPGRERFKGEMFHSARWNHQVDLRNKRVAVIGNGCSGAQVVPEIVKEPGIQVVNFCRTPSWVIPAPRFEYSSLQKWVFAHVPFAMRAHRAYHMFMLEMMWPLFVGESNWRRTKAETLVKGYIKSKTPEKYHDRLMPDYPMGCKRLVLDTGYLTAMHRENLELNWDGIAEVTETGIRTRKGESLPFDVIIFSTGYEADGYPIPVWGRAGQTVQEYFNAHGGPTAYHAMSIHGFPNFYLLGGPNSGTSAGSIVFFEECQTNYILQLVAPVLRGDARAFEVTAAACAADDADVQARLAGTIYPRCNSWYRTGHEGKNFSIFPGPLTRYWWVTRTPVWGDYVATGAGRWRVKRVLGSMGRAVGLAALVMGVVWGRAHPEAVWQALVAVHGQCVEWWYVAREFAESWHTVGFV
ncbi:FAD/NAD-binding domain-containing protein [Obba rivulosa]|uniref:FAD/NAD-binding domain-containing protein n=1 Tax=Obba rivulosa TaxID=1052685 RepID=A0A8E2DIV8_9APHY|nr:FAD/NAD-binding domain-containing protein [Obba rivulosa]